MDVDALAKTKGVQHQGEGRREGRTRSLKPRKFGGHCFWCGAHGHVMKDCRKRAAGKPKTAQSPRTSEPKVKGKRQRRPRQEGSVPR